MKRHSASEVAAMLLTLCLIGALLLVGMCSRESSPAGVFIPDSISQSDTDLMLKDSVSHNFRVKGIKSSKKNDSIWVKKKKVKTGSTSTPRRRHHLNELL
ncbi:MAG: hypothetical protein K2M79_04185 [Muribaculaceae bacterium]|nr:hypothetical protein [Muribaculaceae bacterium]